MLVIKLKNVSSTDMAHVAVCLPLFFSYGFDVDVVSIVVVG